MEEMLEEMGAIIFKAFISGETVRDIATALYNAGYRKQSDTIREFAEKLKALPNRDLAHSYQLGCLVLSDKDIDNLVAEYGVEVE